MEIRRGERGFTLMEVMIAMAVSMAILTAGTALYINGIKQSVASQSQSLANSQAQKLASMIENDIKQGAEVIGYPGVTINGSPYYSTATVLVLKLPSYTWNSGTGVATTIANTYDYIVYQFIENEVVGGVTHKVNNFWRIVSKNGASYRDNTAGWVFPYSDTLDASNAAYYRSDPYVMYWLDSTNGNAKTTFKYYVQDGTTGKVKERGTAAWNTVVVVEARMTVYKKYDQSTIPSEVATRTRLRNWQPPS